MRSRDRPIVVGRLVEHGRAPYRFRVGQDLSYFVKLVTSDGMSILWGQDLARALRTAVTRPQIGDLVGARRVSREAVTLTRREHDTRGNIVRETEHPAYRTRWELEKVKHFTDRARLARLVRDRQIDARDAVRAHPELKSAFLTLRAAEAIAARRILDPRDRARFVALFAKRWGTPWHAANRFPTCACARGSEPRRRIRSPFRAGSETIRCGSGGEEE